MLNTVWVAEETIDYEGDTLLGVGRTKETAMAFCRKHRAELMLEPTSDWWLDGKVWRSGDYVVYEVTLDEYQL